MSVSVADFCRDLVTSWVYIRSFTSSRSYTLAASFTLEYGAQSCGAPI